MALLVVFIWSLNSVRSYFSHLWYHKLDHAAWSNWRIQLIPNHSVVLNTHCMEFSRSSRTSFSRIMTLWLPAVMIRSAHKLSKRGRNLWYQAIIIFKNSRFVVTKTNFGLGFSCNSSSSLKYPFIGEIKMIRIGTKGENLLTLNLRK